MPFLIKNKRYLSLGTVLILICLIILPFELEIAPERHIRIVDVNDKPVTSAMVRHIWHQYSLEKHGVFDVKVDINGEVSIPRRAVRTNILNLFEGAFKEILDLGLHASIGSNDMVGIFARGYDDEWFYRGKAPRKGTIIIRKNVLSKEKKP